MAKVIGFACLAPVFLLTAALSAKAQKADAYPQMAPLEQYLMADTSAEIALAKTAAAKSISDDAEVMVLDRQGYKTAAKGTNGFVCMVLRSWTAGNDDPEYWNQKIRSPICLNPPAVRSYLPIVIAKTNLALAGKSEAQIFDTIEAELDRKELPPIEPGAMCYMLSKEGYLADKAGHFHPHLMFFAPHTEDKVWGANLPGSAVLSGEDIPGRVTIFFVVVRKWSDGTTDN